MVKFLGGALLVVMVALAWRVGSMLSSDAIGMAVGMALGVLAGLPTAALVLLTQRRNREDDRGDEEERRGAGPGYGYQPPVIVLTGPGYPAGQGQPAPPALPPAQTMPWPDDRRQRQYRVVGEVDRAIE